ncbi:MAG: hypothetical protein E7254_00205 [Lachnospiraceae bacterium]|nr:hypothetical protein [Lachnospiraceae bacterium]
MKKTLAVVLAVATSMVLLTGCSFTDIKNKFVPVDDASKNSETVEVTEDTENTVEETTENPIKEFTINYSYILNGATRDLYENSYMETSEKLSEALSKYGDISDEGGTANTISIRMKMDTSKNDAEEVVNNVLKDLELEELLKVDSVEEVE